MSRRRSRRPSLRDFAKRLGIDEAELVDVITRGLGNGSLQRVGEEVRFDDVARLVRERKRFPPAGEAVRGLGRDPESARPIVDERVWGER